MSLIEREIARINRALVENPEGSDYDKLYAAQQALAWVLEPTGIRSPYDLIIGGIQEEPEGCSVEPRLPQS